MSDLIKKIKIKKQDGTYTDYIPIGAEAKNIDCSDGESVEYKLNKKPYYYNNIADMKADTKLKVGDIVIIKNDCMYNIVNNVTIVDTFEILNNNLYAIKSVNDNVKKSPAMTKEFRNTIVSNFCYINGDTFIYRVDSMPIMKEKIKNQILWGVKKFTIDIQVCFFNNIFYQPLTNSMLRELMEYTQKLGHPIDFIKIHEYTPIDTIANNYSIWKEKYEEFLNNMIQIGIQYNIKYLTILNEKGEFYNNPLYTSDIISWINLVKNNNLIPGITTNEPITIPEIVNACPVHFINMYPVVSYNENLLAEDVYDVILTNLLLTLSKYSEKEKENLYISEIGVLPWIQFMAQPAAWDIKSWYNENLKQYRMYNFYAMKCIETLPNCIGGNDFYADDDKAENLTDIRKYYLEGSVSNVIL